MKELSTNIGSHKQEIITTVVFIVITAVFTLALSLLQLNISTYLSIQKNILAIDNTYQTNDTITRSISKDKIDLHAFTDVLPSQNTVINWVEQTENISKDTNVQQTLTFASGELTKDTIVLPPQIGGTNIPSVSGNIVLKGSYNAIVSYISMLQNDYYYTRIDGITFANSAANGPSTTTPPTPVPKAKASDVVCNITFHLFVKDISSTPTH